MSNKKENFEEVLFKIKPMEFQKKMRQICLQSENGPCPLIAILNFLLLTNKVSVEDDKEFLTGDLMVRLLVNYILEISKNKEDINEEDVKEILDNFDQLKTGLDVNVRFSSVLDFEKKDNLLIFEFLGIKLYHTWVMDPQSTPEFDVIHKYSYEEATLELLKEDATISDETKVFLQDFVNSTQGTYHGIFQLSETMQEDELGILFHQNHFSVIVKKKSIYVLCTDSDLSTEPDTAWYLFNSLSGDTDFVNARFEPSKDNSDTDLQLARKLAVDDDYQIAMAIQEEENRVDDIPITETEPEHVNNRHHQKKPSNISFETRSDSRSKESSCCFL